MNAILDDLKSTPGFDFIASLDGDRHLFRAPVAAVEERDDFQRLRGKAVEKIDTLQSSMKRTGGTSLYPITVFAERDADGALHLYVVDGSQRLRAEKQNGAKTVIVQYVSRWATLTEAFADAIDLNFARYEVGEDDVISIIQTGKLTVAEVAAHTGVGETTVRDYAKFANLPWACDLVKAKAVPRTKLGKLIDACANNGGKVEALGNALAIKLEEARQKAGQIANRMKADKKRKYPPKFKERASVAFYFKDESWDAWMQAVEDDITETRDGRRYLLINVGAGGGKAAAPFVGETPDWEKEIAVYDFFGRKHDDLLTEDMVAIREQWDEIGAKIDAIIARRRVTEAKDAHPIPTANPVVPMPAAAPPEPQTPRAKVGRRPRTD